MHEVVRYYSVSLVLKLELFRTQTHGHEQQCSIISLQLPVCEFDDLFVKNAKVCTMRKFSAIRYQNLNEPLILYMYLYGVCDNLRAWAENILLLLQESYQVPFKFLRVVKDMISLSVKLVRFIADLELCRPNTPHMHYVDITSASMRATVLCMQLLTTLTYLHTCIRITM